MKEVQQLVQNASAASIQIKVLGLDFFIYERHFGFELIELIHPHLKMR